MSTTFEEKYRNHMITDGNGFVISMHFSTPIISVTLQGRNLGDLFRKLLKHEVEWVMEFDPREWPAPAEVSRASSAFRLSASRCRKNGQ